MKKGNRDKDDKGKREGSAIPLNGVGGTISVSHKI